MQAITMPFVFLFLVVFVCQCLICFSRLLSLEQTRIFAETSPLHPNSMNLSRDTSPTRRVRLVLQVAHSLELDAAIGTVRIVLN